MLLSVQESAVLAQSVLSLKPLGGEGVLAARISPLFDCHGTFLSPTLAC